MEGSITNFVSKVRYKNICIHILITAFIRLKESTSIAECYARFNCLQIHHLHVNYGHSQSPSICPTTAMERKQ